MKNTLFIIVSLLMSLSASSQRSDNRPSAELDQAMKKFGSTMYLIDRYYVDDADISDLTKKAVISATKNLDPHSSYISKEEYKSMNEPLQGNFEGIGIEFNILNDTLIVVSPLSGGPSEKVGLRSSDRIIAADGKNIAGVGITNDSVFKTLRGPKGSKIVLTVKRHSEVIDFEIIRDKIPIFSVDAAYEITKGMAYIKLNKFSLSSMKEIRDAWKKFKDPKSLILDFRGNSGGVMQTSVELADQFFDAGKLLVYTEGTNAPKHMEFSTDSGLFKNGDLVVLVDEGSASASEIVAGAIQDWDRGILIGRRTFGKGLVQQIFPLGDGTYLKLTVSRYHTPTGRVIQRPYDMGKTEQYYEDLYKRFSGEIYSKDSISFPDSLKYRTLKNSRTVYGGGGIMPDIFIPADTSTYSKYSGQLYRKGLIHQFVMEYMDKSRDSLKAKYPAFEAFAYNYKVSDVMFEDLLNYAEKAGVAKDSEGIAVSAPDLKKSLKALVARDLFTTSEFYQVINNGDKTYEKAIEILKNRKKYGKEILAE